MKGQTQAVTAVLITSVVVGSVATAYVWGTPILEKRQGQADLQNIEKEIIGVHEAISEVSRSGRGTSQEVNLGDELQSSRNFEISVNGEKNYIEVTTEANNPPYPLGTWSLIRGQNLQNLSFGTGSYGIAGEDLPGVVAVKAEGSPDSATLIYRIEFRNLYVQAPSGARLQRVNISSRGQRIGTTDASLLISNEGSEWQRGTEQVQISSGERLDRKNIQVRVDIR